MTTENSTDGPEVADASNGELAPVLTPLGPDTPTFDVDELAPRPMTTLERLEAAGDFYRHQSATEREAAAESLRQAEAFDALAAAIGAEVHRRGQHPGQA